MVRRERTPLAPRQVSRRELKFVVIATEGEKTEPAYFEQLKQLDWFDASRVDLVILGTPEETHASSPGHVIDRLIAEEQRRPWNRELDEFWIVIDVDRWKEKMLAEVATLALQKGFFLAASNPCFELWLLHVADPIPGKQGREYEAALREAVGANQKNKLPLSLLNKDALLQAIRRARSLDGVASDRWPQTTGSRVYRLVEPLLRP
jgi:hypothetical protein